jgi:hypothetical protein
MTGTLSGICEGAKQEKLGIGFSGFLLSVPAVLSGDKGDVPAVTIAVLVDVSF